MSHSIFELIQFIKKKKGKDLHILGLTNNIDLLNPNPLTKIHKKK